MWFSCGAASAVASKLAVDKYGHDLVRVVYCNTLPNEHPDNSRFMSDVEGWIEQPVTIIDSLKYKTIEEVFDGERYMSGIAGARCTVELKRKPRVEFQEYGDLHIFGLTADEKPRIQRFKDNNPNLLLEWNLLEAGVTKENCYSRLQDASIPLPTMYSLGFKNNNCLGCVKSSSPAYWDKIRVTFPEVFKRRCEQSRELGVRLLKYHGKRIFLDELPPRNTDNTPEQDIECGPICLTER